MTSSSEQIIAVIYPTLSSSASLPIYLEMAGNYIDTQFARDFFDSTRNMALAYVACHYFSLYGDSKNSATTDTGPVASKSEGDLSVSYAVIATASSDSFGTTKYGKMFLDMVASRKRLCLTLGVNGGCRL